MQAQQKQEHEHDHHDHDHDHDHGHDHSSCQGDHSHDDHDHQHGGLSKQMQQRRQKYINQLHQQKNHMMPLVKYLKKHGLKIKHARWQNASVQYFRVDQINALIEERKQHIEQSPSLKQLLASLPDSVIYFRRPDNQPKMKYPQVLEPSQSAGKFAAFKFDTTQSRKLLMISILLGVLLMVLFPLWPYSVKYALWIVSLYALTALLSVIIIRIIFYMVFAILGFSFWIFPNLFGDCTILESFKPFYSLHRWDTSIFSIICRIAALSIVGYYGYHIYLDPSIITENLQISKTAFDDVHDWGVKKIKGDVGNFSQRALTNLDIILNQTADLSDNSTFEANATGAEL